MRRVALCGAKSSFPARSIARSTAKGQRDRSLVLPPIDSDARHPRSRGCDAGAAPHHLPASLPLRSRVQSKFGISIFLVVSNNRSGYVAPPMGGLGTRHSGRRGCVFPSAALSLCLVVVAAMASGCVSKSQTRSSHSDGESAPNTAASGPANHGVEEAVAAGWKAAIEADDEAERTSDPQAPMLAATHVQPQLGRLVANLETYRLNGWIGVGSDKVLHVTVSDVGNGRADVTGCINGNEIEVSTSDGRPAPGFPGEKGPVTFHALMVRTAAGWEIAQQTATEGPCPVE